MSDQRQAIAQAAAALIVEQELDDWGLARRKAARTLGLGPRAEAPSAEEIECALRNYVSAHLVDEQAALVGALRREALDWMSVLREFDPLLTGAAAEGWAYPGCGLRIELLADDSKSVEIALLNRQREVAHEARIRNADQPEVLLCDGDTGVVRLVIQSLAQRRNRRKGRVRLDPTAVAAALQEP